MEPGAGDVYLAGDDDDLDTYRGLRPTQTYFTNATTTPGGIPASSSNHTLNLRIIPEKQKLGYLSLASLIINKMVGTGIFATPGIVLQCTGSKGISLLLWLLGGLLSLSGLVLFVELGLKFPYTGGEFVYLSEIFSRPRYLVACMWASIFVLLHTSAANAILISDYMITALSASPISMDHSHHLRKAIAVLTITIAVLIDYFWGKIGRRLNNAVAVFKLGFLAFIILTGFVVFGGAKMRGTSEASGNLDNAFYGQTASPYLYGSAFSSITYSFQGWEVANYVLSDIKRPKGDPNKVFKRAAFVSVLVVAALYIGVNVAFFYVLSTTEIIDSDLYVAAVFFNKVFGDNFFTTRGLDVFVALSSFGNMLTISYTCAKVKQEMSTQGILPFSSFWVKGSPSGSPAGGLLLHWIFTTVAVLVVPLNRSKDTVSLLLNAKYYASGWGYAAIGFGFLTIKYHPSFKGWIPNTMRFGFLAILALLFGLAYTILITVLWWPVSVFPNGASMAFPFWIPPLVGSSIIVSGALYYVVYLKVLPALGFKMTVSREELVDGTLVVEYKHVCTGRAEMFSKFWNVRHRSFR